MLSRRILRRRVIGSSARRNDGIDSGVVSFYMILSTVIAMNVMVSNILRRKQQRFHGHNWMTEHFGQGIFQIFQLNTFFLGFGASYSWYQSAPSWPSSTLRTKLRPNRVFCLEKCAFDCAGRVSCAFQNVAQKAYWLTNIYVIIIINIINNIQTLTTTSSKTPNPKLCLEKVHFHCARAVFP